nr:reverse transcriptase domain-containing protein [Tanacetum cinerariifolium]
SFQAEEEPNNYALMDFSSLSSSSDNKIAPSFVQSTEQVKSPRYFVQHIETSILAATTKLASPKPASSGKQRNRKHALGNPKQYAQMTHHNPQKHMVRTAVLTQSKPVSIPAVRPISAVVPQIKVKFATCTLLDAALTWWNTQIRSLGPDAYSLTWEVLKKKMTNKDYPQGKIKKLEIKLWNLKVKENNVSVYTERFQELTLICTKFVADEAEKIDKYVSRLPDNIYGSVKASKPKTLDETIE